MWVRSAVLRAWLQRFVAANCNNIYMVTLLLLITFRMGHPAEEVASASWSPYTCCKGEIHQSPFRERSRRKLRLGNDLHSWHSHGGDTSLYRVATLVEKLFVAQLSQEQHERYHRKNRKTAMTLL